MVKMLYDSIVTKYQWCVWFFVFATGICKGFLNIEELTNSKYALQILNNPLNDKDVDNQIGLRLASKHGQYYFCSLPVSSEKSTEKEEDRIPKSTPVQSLLEPLRTKECFKIVKGWWTYELCYGKHILQYHMESNGAKGDVTHLGSYEADFDWNKEAMEETIHSKRHMINRYHSQTYVNGTACDVINHDRDTEVRYFCDESTGETYIDRVDEPSTCSYVITIKTPYICSHPRTRPIVTHKPQGISCRPVLSQEDYSEFQMVQAWKKQQAEIETLRQIEREKLLLEKFMNGEMPTKLQNLQKFDFMQNYLSLENFLQPVHSNVDIDATRRMVEVFASIKDLQKLDSFQQKRLLMDVSDLMKIHKDLPTADQARIIQNYVTRFIQFPTASKRHNFHPFSGNDRNSGYSSIERKPSHAKKPLKVHLKFQKLNLEKLTDLEDEDMLTTDDDVVVDPAWKKLEEDITQGLEDVGYQSDESHFEIRVITSKDSITDSIKLDAEESERFRQMLVELVAGSSAMTKEVAKQKSLTDNYNMVWKKDSATFAVLDWEKDDNEDVLAKQL